VEDTPQDALKAKRSLLHWRKVERLCITSYKMMVHVNLSYSQTATSVVHSFTQHTLFHAQASNEKLSGGVTTQPRPRSSQWTHCPHSHQCTRLEWVMESNLNTKYDTHTHTSHSPTQTHPSRTRKRGSFCPSAYSLPLFHHLKVHQCLNYLLPLDELASLQQHRLEGILQCSHSA